MAVDTQLKFHWADYLVFALSLAISAAIGIYFAFAGDRQKNTTQILMGGKNMNALPVAMSMLASFISAIYIIGVPAEIYYYGIMFSLIGIGYIMLMMVGAHIFVPMFHKMQVVSAHEYLEARFSKTVRVLGALTFTVMMVLYLAVCLYAPALAFSQVTGLSMEATIIGSGIICTFYTTLGGMKAVIWTDTFQMIIIFAGLFTLVIKGTYDVGGIQKVYEINLAGGRLNLTTEKMFQSGLTERQNFWTQSIGCLFTFLSLTGANQTIVQRYLTIKKKRDAIFALYVVLFTVLIVLALVTVLGLVIYASYVKCDPMVAGLITKGDQLVPLFLMQTLGHLHGLPGLFSASVFAAALSTVSSAVNSLAAVWLVDLIKPAHYALWKKNLSEKAATWTCRGLAITFGVLTILLSYVAPYFGKMLIQISLSIFGTAGGPLFAVFALGMFVPCCNAWGAGFGLIASIALTYWVNGGALVYNTPTAILPIGIKGCFPVPNPITISSNITTTPTTTTTTLAAMTTTLLTTLKPTLKPIPAALASIYRLSFMWYGLLSLVVALVVGLLVSAMTCFRRGRQPVDPALLFLWADKCCCCCSESCKKPCRCGVDPDYEPDDKTADQNDDKPLELSDVNLTKGEVNPAYSSTGMIPF